MTAQERQDDDPPEEQPITTTSTTSWNEPKLQQPQNSSQDEDSSHPRDNDDDKDNNNNNKDDPDSLQHAPPHDQQSVSVAQQAANRLYRGELLAPMVRASTTPLRTLALHYGATAVYTEELMDRSIVHTTRVWNADLQTVDYVKDVSQASAKTLRRLQREGGPPLLLRIDPRREAGKLIAQLGTGEPDLALAAAQHVCQDVAGMDLNMGCPKKFSVSGGMGSALLSDPQRACRILQTWRTYLPSPLPISAKIRLLSSTKAQPTVDFVSALVERGGIQAVAIHGRTVGHQDVVPAKWNLLEQVVQGIRDKYPHMAVLVNGDFYTRNDFTQFLDKTGAHGVLLGRPALYNTSLFRKPPPPSSSTSTTPTLTYGYTSPLLLDKTTVIQDYLHEAVRYDYHYKNIKYVLCEMMNNRRAPTPRVRFLNQDYPGQQTIAQVCASQSLQALCQVWNVQYSAVATAQRQQQRQGQGQPTSMGPSDGSSLPTTTPAAGEHKYDDAYLLQTMGPTAASPNKSCSPETDTTGSTTTQTTATTTLTTHTGSSSSSFLEPQPKRTRVE